MEISLNKFKEKNDSPTLISIITSGIMSAVLMVIFALNINNLPNQLPLFYSLSWGENQLVNLPQFVILPSLILLLILINLIVSWQLHPSQSVLKKTLAGSTLFISTLLFLAALKIIFTFI